MAQAAAASRPGRTPRLGPPVRGHATLVREQVTSAFVGREQGGQVLAGLAEPREQPLDCAQSLLVKLRLRHHQGKQPGLGLIPGSQHRCRHIRLARLAAAGTG
ncbi:MAG: hypothetical protein ACRDOH_29115, partial [Streptosporangiaceae bacterium]